MCVGGAGGGVCVLGCVCVGGGVCVRACVHKHILNTN